MVFINLALSVSVVFLMRYVQNLLNSDVKINLVEIVTQNKDAITSRLMMNVNSLDITANKLSDRLKAEESSGKLKTQDLIEQYAKENNTDDLFTANRDGMALFDGGRKLDISGRHYFRLAIDGIPNISDKLISRINGDEVFVISVPLSYNGEIVGTIQKVITFEEMYKICSLSIFSSQGYMYVINREGYVILHSAHPKCEQKSDNYFRDLYGAGNPKDEAGYPEQPQRIHRDDDSREGNLLGIYSHRKNPRLVFDYKRTEQCRFSQRQYRHQYFLFHSVRHRSYLYLKPYVFLVVQEQAARAIGKNCLCRYGYSG